MVRGWGAHKVETNGLIGALEDWIGTNDHFPFCRCCSVFLSPQLYCDAPSLSTQSFLFGGIDRPRDRAVAHPGPCRLRPRLVRGPMPGPCRGCRDQLPGTFLTPVAERGGVLKGPFLGNPEMLHLNCCPLSHQKNLIKPLPSSFQLSASMDDSCLSLAPRL